MFVDITNGNVSCRVSKGAFDSYYKSIGYYIVGEDKDSSSFDNVVKDAKDDDMDNSIDNNDMDEKETNENDEDALFVEEIMEKSITQWTPDEMKRFAMIKGIDTSSAKKTSEARNIIREFLANEDKNKVMDV